MTGNAEPLRQAVLMALLTGAMCSPPDVWQMVVLQQTYPKTIVLRR